MLVGYLQMCHDKNGLWELYKLYGSQDRMAIGSLGISKAFNRLGKDMDLKVQRGS